MNMAARHNEEIAIARALNTSKVCLGFDTPRALELGRTMDDGDIKVWLAFSSSSEEEANTSFLLAECPDGYILLRFAKWTISLSTFVHTLLSNMNVASGENFTYRSVAIPFFVLTE